MISKWWMIKANNNLSIRKAYCSYLLTTYLEIFPFYFYFLFFFFSLLVHFVMMDERKAKGKKCEAEAGKERDGYIEATVPWPSKCLYMVTREEERRGTPTFLLGRRVRRAWSGHDGPRPAEPHECPHCPHVCSRASSASGRQQEYTPDDRLCYCCIWIVYLNLITYLQQIGCMFWVGYLMEASTFKFLLYADI